MIFVPSLKNELMEFNILYTPPYHDANPEGTLINIPSTSDNMASIITDTTIKGVPSFTSGKVCCPRKTLTNSRVRYKTSHDCTYV